MNSQAETYELFALYAKDTGEFLCFAEEEDLAREIAFEYLVSDGIRATVRDVSAKEAAEICLAKARS